ncbi:saccharopine dehydrogenase family protein [Cellulomonas marina]|uniref:Uncharacterized conserved protein n=1 Tax=Cellulomonas marina TaxID=988821 RepID=A0A1I0ZBR4_9CELL|nr:saccharopine dehydrogenase NADP-binding domain-containing protein [Cellulomonas marina]GIG30620.1 putative trans-acting enoyl reductase [Cellulomonas marina]SFB22842.1 Uncharacterized conserved protein [Cellulomonas marina]
MGDDARDHDLVLLGASGFVGRLVAAHVARHAPPGLRVALAGRSAERLAQVRGTLPPPAQDWPALVVDVGDDAALARLARATRVLVTTVGPYARHGLPVVAACAAAGTHYADLTGEAPFVRAAADATDAVARTTGARLVHACGWDSVPSDLSVLLLHEAARADGASGLTDVTVLVAAKGGFSGGTVASMRGVLDASRANPAAARLTRDPYALSPDRAAEPPVAQPPDHARPGLRRGRWTAPFLMASFNTRVVRRSNALTGWAYGRGLRYAERMDTGRGFAGAAGAVGVTLGLGALVGALSLPPIRPLVDRLLPAPGDGPDEATRTAGWFRHHLLATTQDGSTYAGRVAGHGDPGYAATAVMLGQTALALALDEARLPDRAGSLTPATALGTVLVGRLREHGHRYDTRRL